MFLPTMLIDVGTVGLYRREGDDLRTRDCEASVGIVSLLNESWFQDQVIVFDADDDPKGTRKIAGILNIHLLF